MRKVSYERYISKLLQNKAISINAKQQLDSILSLFSRIFSKQILEVTLHTEKKVFKLCHITKCIKLSFPEELYNHICKTGKEVLENYEKNKEKKHISRQEKSGLVFSPSTCEKFLKRYGTVSYKSSLLFSTVIETLCRKLLAEAERVAEKKRIVVKDLDLGKESCDSLSTLFHTFNLSFQSAAVAPFIHPFLLNKKSRGKKKEETVYRFRPGTVALREIKRLQKSSNCLLITREHFEKLTRQNTSKKLSKDFILNLQYHVEQKIVNFLQKVSLVSIHAGRVKVSVEDVELVRKLLL